MPNYSGAGGRPSGQKTAPPEVKAYWGHLVDEEGMSPGAAAEKLGYAYETGKTWAALRQGKAKGQRRRPFEGPVNEIPPKELEDLDDTAYAAIQETPEGFELFRSTYMQRPSRVWQAKACADLLEAELQSRDSEVQLPFYLIENVFPGGGKSTTVHDYVAWRIVCHRARGLERRVQLGSRTITQSRKYTIKLRETFEANQALIRAYGRFKPLKPILWEQTAFFIENLPGVRHDQQEPTVFAVSQDSGFLGYRGHICIWDDLISRANSRTMEGRDALRAWWADEAESRVEPGGLVALIGTRYGPTDLFRTLSDLKVEVAEDADDLYAVAERPIYHTITYPVHDESRCQNLAALHPDLHRDGCLNDPQRYPWQRILRLKKQVPERFELTWQQSDTGGEVGLVRRVWLEGGDDENGNLFVGCYDYERGMWEPPPQSALEDYRGVITVDPSPTMYWAVQLWVFDRKHDLDYLVGQERKKMDIPTLLDMQDGKYVGLLEEFIQHAARLQVRVKHLVWEANAAQRFVLQYPFFRDWARNHGIILMGHTTSGPKLADPDYGIEMLGPRYMHGKIRLPFKGTISKDRVNPLINELLSWPDGDYDDCVKAQWFGHYNRDRLGAGKDARRFYTDDIELPPALAEARRGGSW